MLLHVVVEVRDPRDVDNKISTIVNRAGKHNTLQVNCALFYQN